MPAHTHDSRSSRRGVAPAQAVALGLVAAAIGWGAWLVHERPAAEEVELLPGTVLPSSELAIVEAAFDRAQLADHRCEDGRIWVARPRQSAYMRALVDAEALPREFGSSLRRAIETNSPWQSRAAQVEHMRVAVQEELAHVICSMPGIERAAVLYDVGDRGGGLDGGLGAGPIRTASVNVRTQPDAELEPARVQAIRVLVAASIAGLEPERVAVTDLRSGRVHAGPLPAAAPEHEAAVDRELTRRIAHERHLAAKVRQALGFVKGAVVDVTVTLPPAVTAPGPAAAAPSPPDPGPERPHRRQRAAAANAPAVVGGDFAAIDDEPDPQAGPPPRPPVATPDGPDTIVVSIAVPESYFGAAVRAARDRDPAANPTSVEAHERQRLAEHVRTLLPPTPRAEDRRVAITAFPDARTREGRAVVAQPVAAPPRAEASQAARRAADVAGAAWDAVARGDVAAVPREAWLVGGAVLALVLVLVVVRRPEPDRRDPRPRRRQPRIDWSAIDRREGDDDVPDAAARVAA